MQVKAPAGGGNGHTCLLSCRSHSDTVLSRDPDSSMRPSLDQATEVTAPLQQSLESCSLCADHCPTDYFGQVDIPVWFVPLCDTSGLSVPDDHLAISTTSCSIGLHELEEHSVPQHVQTKLCKFTCEQGSPTVKCNALRSSVIQKLFNSLR